MRLSIVGARVEAFGHALEQCAGLLMNQRRRQDPLVSKATRL
jgi:hypothetical protein